MVGFRNSSVVEVTNYLFLIATNFVNFNGCQGNHPLKRGEFNKCSQKSRFMAY